MYIKRSIYQQLTDWKNEPSHSTLEVRGARQVGKTYIINKFADDNFKRKINISFFEPSGKRFLEAYQAATRWTPGTPRPEHPLRDAFRLFDPDFEDAEDTVIIIDEIQESAEIYNRIREFTRQFRCRFILVVSYPGKTSGPDFRFSCGDVTCITMYPLSFEEFAAAADRELFQKDLCSVNLDSFQVQCDEKLAQLYEIYCQIGGYPAVVNQYLTTGSIEAGTIELSHIIETFFAESLCYLTDIPDSSVFTDIFLHIVQLLVKKETDSPAAGIGENLLNLLIQKEGVNLSRAIYTRAVNWLYHSSMIGYCGQIEELDILEFRSARHCYFMDLGITNYFMDKAGVNKICARQIIDKNYVYINLEKRLKFPCEIAFEIPVSASYKNREIDFYVQSLGERTRYAIAVKSDMRSNNAAMEALEDGRVDYLLHLNGNTHDVVEGKTITRPIYTLEWFRF